ncbi:MAG TPA: hypothetical protein VGZ47_15420 [Gemmataceae bacterium]|jgi:DNA-directed RNA polymerase specialized sigma24 family protein|nr:hypothetical protein [Gemmataceae bacterium]
MNTGVSDPPDMDIPGNPMLSPPPARPATETDWPAFIDCYGRVILTWFRQSSLPTEEVPIIVREFLMGVHREFCAVINEPALKFRSWLQFAAHASWCDVLEKRTDEQGEADAPVALLTSVEAHDQFLKALDAECTRQRRREALRRVELSADAADWEAFSMAVLDQQPMADVAAAFECDDSAIRAALYRVRSRLEQECVRMEETT